MARGIGKVSIWPEQSLIETVHNGMSVLPVIVPDSDSIPNLHGARGRWSFADAFAESRVFGQRPLTAMRHQPERFSTPTSAFFTC